MLEKELLEIIVCPKTRTPLRVADRKLVARLNEAIAAGRIANQRGQAVEEPLAGGLVCRDDTLLYPIVDDIPVLLIDEAISLEQING